MPTSEQVLEPLVPRARGKGSGRERGGQYGHEGRYRRLLPPERVEEIVEHWPDRCASCAREFVEADRLDAAEPSRHQVAELSPVAMRVTEHRLHSEFPAPTGCVTAWRSASSGPSTLFAT
jgi:hypothetical protein